MDSPIDGFGEEVAMPFGRMSDLSSTGAGGEVLPMLVDPEVVGKDKVDVMWMLRRLLTVGDVVMLSRKMYRDG